MKLVVLLIALCIAACASVEYCDYALYEKGWTKAGQPPTSLIDEYNKDDIWFTNSSGDYFSCPELKKEGVCINVYQIYRRQDDGSFESDHIVCLE